MKKVISAIGLLLFGAVSVFCFQHSRQAFAEDRDANSAPEVITTLTDEQAQQRDKQRPKYLQPKPIDGKAPVTSLPIEPQQGETIVFIGNSLAERMDHHNFFESSLHQTFADKEITFRNMGFPGHTPAFRPEAGNGNPWAFPGAEKFHPELKTHLGPVSYTHLTLPTILLV